MKFRKPTAALLAMAAGCADTGQREARVPLFVAGSDVSEPIVAASDVPVRIDRADLAFGPLYLCAGANAGDLCDTARLEWLDTVVVDATDPEPAPAGELTGVTGTVRSWMYDLGISSQLTRNEPFVLDAAQTLGGASLVIEGRAVVDDMEVAFTGSVPIQQTDDTELGVPVLRRSTSDPFFRDVGDDEVGLLVRFDPATWIRRINFRAYVGDQACTQDGPGTVCDGTVERSCDGLEELASRDCSEFGQICVPDEGCADRVTIQRETEAFRGLRNALVSGVRPSFEWDYAP